MNSLLIEYHAPGKNRMRGRQNSAEFGRKFNPSLKDINSLYDKYLVWLCWEAAANVSRQRKFPAHRENTGNSIEIGSIARASR